MNNDYPVVYIPIEYLFYKILHPKYKEEPVDDYMGWITYMEKNLELMYKNDHFPMNEREANMIRVFKGIKKQGMIYPLVVKKELDIVYYVIVGNQRLCCLRAMGWDKAVPCVIAKPEDSWEDNTEATKHLERII